MQIHRQFISSIILCQVEPVYPWRCFFHIEGKSVFIFSRSAYILSHQSKWPNSAIFISAVPRGEDLLQGWNNRKLVSKPHHNIIAYSMDVP